jgi:serine/threonine-protein kinase
MPDQTTDQPRPKDADTMPAPDAVGHALFERLGVGDMGEVYRCGDDALRRDLTIKVIKAKVRGDDDAEQHFLREARLTGSLKHPSVVPVHKLGRLADGQLFYTMKLVRGRTLDDLLRDEPDGPERLPRLLAVVEKACQAMAYAHSEGTVGGVEEAAGLCRGRVRRWGRRRTCLRSRRPAIGTSWTSGPTCSPWAPCSARS